MISSRAIYLAGLKKWVPQKFLLKSSLRPSASCEIGMPDVLDVTNEPGFLYISTFSNISLLMSSLSTTTSITQSQELINGISSSKLPVVILDMNAWSYSGAGLDFMAFARAVSAIRFLALRTAGCASLRSGGTMSSMMTCRPEFARWQAMPEPMTPDPSTATFWMMCFILLWCMGKFKKHHKNNVFSVTKSS